MKYLFMKYLFFVYSFLFYFTLFYLTLFFSAKAQLIHKITNGEEKFQYFQSIVVLDWNNDGLQDAITGHYVNQGIWLHLQQKNGTYTTQEFELNTEKYSEIQYLLPTKFNKDENMDLVVLHSGGISIVLGNGKDEKLNKKVILVDNQYFTEAMMLDVDDDGEEDIVAMTNEEGVFWFKNTKSDKNIFKKSKLFDYKKPMSMLKADVNEDKKMDIIFSNEEGIKIFWNNGKNNFQGEQISRKPKLIVKSVEKMQKNAPNSIITFNEDKIWIYKYEKKRFVEQIITVALQKDIHNLSFLGKSSIQYLMVLDINQDGKKDIFVMDFNTFYLLFQEKNNDFFSSDKLFRIPEDIMKPLADNAIFLKKQSKNEDQKMQFVYANTNKISTITLSLPQMLVVKNIQDYKEKPPFEQLSATQWKKSYSWLNTYFGNMKNQSLLMVFYPETQDMGFFISKNYVLLDKNIDVKTSNLGNNKKMFMSDEKAQETQYSGDGNNKKQKETLIYKDRETYNDGLTNANWSFKITRDIADKKNPFAIIASPEAREKITLFLQNLYNFNHYLPDVFQYQYTEIVEGILANNINQDYLGAYIQNILYLFDEKGDLVEVRE